MKIMKNIVLSNTSRPTLADVFVVKNETPKPLVVFCHGFKGFKDWGAWNLVASEFANQGFVFVKFNLSHNGGTIENPIDFPDLEAFGHNTYSKELFDIDAMLNWVTGDDFPLEKEEYDTRKIFLIGHSRGGGVSLLQAANDERISAISTWAAIATLDRFGTRDELKEWQKNGVKHIKNGRTLQDMPMYLDIYRDFQENKDKLSIENACNKLEKPLLIVHGKEDNAVGYSHALRIHNWVKNSELLTLNNANHVFGAKHPWTESALPDDLAKIVRRTVDFLMKHH